MQPLVMDYFWRNSVDRLDQLVLGLLHVWRGLDTGDHLRLGRGLLRPHHHLRGHRWCHWCHDNKMILKRAGEDPWLGRGTGGRNLHTTPDLWFDVFISADVIRVSRSPIKVSAAWQQITSVTYVTPSPSQATSPQKCDYDTIMTSLTVSRLPVARADNVTVLVSYLDCTLLSL